MQMADNGTILLIDTDPYINNANRSALMFNQYSVHSVTTISCARRFLSGAVPDLILMEAILPDGDGFSFCREISGPLYGEPSYGRASPQIIFLSVKTDAADVVMGLKAGADDYIRKPAETEEVVASIEAKLRNVKNKLPRREAD
jgi:two-component system OmpR family response regulator